MRQEICCTGLGQPKVIYRTEAAARKAIRSNGWNARTYFCPYANHRHITHADERNHPAEQPPSAAKLRRKAENAAREIVAGQRRLEAEERALAVRKEKVRQEAASIERAENELRVAIQKMVDRVLGPAKEKV